MSDIERMQAKRWWSAWLLSWRTIGVVNNLAKLLESSLPGDPGELVTLVNAIGPLPTK